MSIKLLFTTQSVLNQLLEIYIYVYIIYIITNFHWWINVMVE